MPRRRMQLVEVEPARVKTAIRQSSRLALLLAIAVGLWLFLWFGPTAVRQARWMAESREVLPAVQASLIADQRFGELRAFVSTGCSVVVFGTIRSEEDEHALHDALRAIAFPHGLVLLARIE